MRLLVKFEYILSTYLNKNFYYFSFLIVACEAATNCSGHGTCRADGTCECDSQFFGADCTSKLLIEFMFFLNSEVVTFFFHFC